MPIDFITSKCYMYITTPELEYITNYLESMGLLVSFRNRRQCALDLFIPRLDSCHGDQTAEHLLRNLDIHWCSISLSR